MVLLKNKLKGVTTMDNQEKVIAEIPCKYVQRTSKAGVVYKCLVLDIDKDYQKLLFLERAESRYLDLLHKAQNSVTNQSNQVTIK